MKAAVSRLDFVPRKKELSVNIEKGTLTFVPVSGKKIDVGELVKRIEDAGYKVPEVKGTVQGRLTRWKEFPALKARGRGQVFVLHDSKTTRQTLGQVAPGDKVRVGGKLSYHVDTPESIMVIEYEKL